MGGRLDLFSAAILDSDEGALTVSDLTKRARFLVESGLSRLWVSGEVTDFKKYRSGHWYFTLRDSSAKVRCVMWRTDNERLPALPQEGSQVFVEAQPTIWEERGEFRLTVKRFVPTDAEGMWRLQLEKARKALETDGLLDPSRKRPLPEYPRRIAVVTSTDGAALRDFCSVVGRRWPCVEVFVLPTKVQGGGAEAEICQALELANRIPSLDLLILTRGGGSREDLWAFNSERVARALAAVDAPTISAVGHETDSSLTDLVADLRAPTPSAAAEAAVPNRTAVIESLNGFAHRLVGRLTSHTRLGEERIARTSDRLASAIQVQLERRGGTIHRIARTLDALSPLKVLDRGYAVARTGDGQLLKRVADFVVGSDFRLTVSDGEVNAQTVGRPSE